MNHVVNDLSLRAMDWLGQERADAVWAARGWALGEQLRRVGGDEVANRVEGRLGSYGATGSGTKPQAPVDGAVVSTVMETARESLSRLLEVLDSVEEEADLEGSTRQAFYEVVEALLIAEKGQGDEAGQKLFNQVVADLYAFEPVADCACAMRTKLVGKVGLADLFCAGVAGFANADGPATKPARVERGAEDFVEVAELVSAGGREMVSLEELAKRLGRSAWYFLKWGVQKVKLAVDPARRVLKLEVHEVAGGSSRRMDGWEVQVRGIGHAVIKSGVATVKLAERVEASRFAVEVRRAGGEEWQGLFGKVSRE